MKTINMKTTTSIKLNIYAWLLLILTCILCVSCEKETIYELQEEEKKDCKYTLAEINKAYNDYTQWCIDCKCCTQENYRRNIEDRNWKMKFVCDEK